MDPITTSIVAALVAGATAATKDVATAAIKDAYTGLKKLIVRRYEATAPLVENIDTKPSDKSEQAALARRLQESGGGADKELQELAKKLLGKIAELKNDPRAEPLFDFDELDVARDLKMTNIESIRQVLRASKTKVGQDFIVDNIRDRSKDANDPKA